MRATKPIQTNGVVTVPKDIREELGVEQGDLVEIDVQKPDSQD